MARRERRNSIQKKPSTRRIKRLFLVATEGTRTETEYFSMEVFRSNPNVSVQFPQRTNSNRTDPASVLNRLTKTLKSAALREGDQAWIVVDVDSWSGADFKLLSDWEAKSNKHFTAISNPKFELFLLMHFDAAGGCTTPKAVDEKLKRYLPNYSKGINPRQFDEKAVHAAISTAKKKRASCKTKFPSPGATDAYKLAEAILES